MTSVNPIRYAAAPGTLYRSTLSEDIKEIQRKIRRCERKIREQWQKSMEERQTHDSKKGFEPMDLNRFDFLTNPGGKPVEEQEQSEQLMQQPERNITPQQNINFISENIERLGLYYARDLKKKFERREMIPHKACKRKTPKLYITQQTNAIQKAGRPLNQQEHIFRVITREVTPQEIYPAIPSFPVVRDVISKNVMAYLSDYKPFIDKTKQVIPQVGNNKQPLGQNQNNTHPHIAADITSGSQRADNIIHQT